MRVNKEVPGENSGFIIHAHLISELYTTEKKYAHENYLETSHSLNVYNNLSFSAAWQQVNNYHISYIAAFGPGRVYPYHSGLLHWH